MTTTSRSFAISVLVLVSLALLPVARAQGSAGWQDLPSVLSKIQPPEFPGNDFDITTFGAIGDGTFNCTNAIRDAIAACSEKGGGRVVVPAGKFLTGPVHLRSNVNLHVSRGATVLFSTDSSEYLPAVYTRWEGVECLNYSPLIYAYGQTNIAITGEGVLDGQGSDQHWWWWNGKKQYGWRDGSPNQRAARGRLFDMAERNVPVAQRVFGHGDYLRPNFIQPYRCTNILIQGVTLRNSPMWFIHPVLSRNISILDVTVEGLGPNNDGCNPESSRDVLIKGCSFNTGDDCIAIKAGRNADGRRVNVPSENIVIQDCVMKDGHGGVVIGSEMTGGVRNVFAERCTMNSPNLDRALRIKTNAVRGGFVENIFFRNVAIGQVAEAVLKINFHYEEGDKGDFPPTIRNVRMSDVTSGKSEYGIWIRTYAHSPATDIVLENCSFSGVSRPSVLEHADNLVLKNVSLNGIREDTPERMRWSARIADAFMSRHPDSITHPNEKKPRSWTYEQGLMLEALRRVGESTGEQRFLEYVLRDMDWFVRDDGSIRTYRPDEFNIDHVNPGRILLWLYVRTGNEKYRTAAGAVRDQLRKHPRTKEGGFWHKKIYPYQMWLDGIYMAEPFYAQYASLFDEESAFDDVAHQILTVERHTRDPRTGLLYHGWDESGVQPWSDKETGHSPHFWGRAMGWYAMGIVDVLDFFPMDHPKRQEIVAVLRRLSRAVARVQDSASGAWYQVLDQASRPGNYLEASASAMFTYAFAKGARKGYLEPEYRAIAERAFEGIIRTFVTADDQTINLHNVCAVAGLGGKPYRDGSFEYYVGEPRRTNDFKGVGSLIMAAHELGR